LSPPNLNPMRFIVNEKVEVSEIMNAPNPFSDTTVFSYYLTQPADKVIIKIYTLRGKLVKTIEQDSPSWKYNEEFWSGKDEDDNKLASGVYFFKFTVYSADRKIEKIGKLAIIR
jgi:flagellar hook assembly protein FlgD